MLFSPSAALRQYGVGLFMAHIIPYPPSHRKQGTGAKPLRSLRPLWLKYTSGIVELRCLGLSQPDYVDGFAVNDLITAVYFLFPSLFLGLLKYRHPASSIVHKSQLTQLSTNNKCHKFISPLCFSEQSECLNGKSSPTLQAHSSKQQASLA